MLPKPNYNNNTQVQDCMLLEYIICQKFVINKQQMNKILNKINVILKQEEFNWLHVQ